jgi:hypothetical protein
MSKFIRRINSSILGLPSNAGQKSKKGADSKVIAASSRRSERPATKANTMQTSRQAQAAACKRLGLIQREEDLNEEVMQQYTPLFMKPLADSQVHSARGRSQ